MLIDAGIQLEINLREIEYLVDDHEYSSVSAFDFPKFRKILKTFSEKDAKEVIKEVKLGINPTPKINNSTYNIVENKEYLLAFKLLQINPIVIFED